MTLGNTQRLFIDGAWIHAEGERKFADYNPANGKIFANVADASRDDAKKAVQAAASAAEAWRQTPHPKRASYLLKAAEILERRQQDFVDALVDEGGSWVGKAMVESSWAASVFREAAASVYQMTGEVLPSEYGKLSLLVREPVGVVTVISPWNFPLVLASWHFAVALALGNTIVLKPSEETPVSGGLMIAEVLEEAGVPNGVFNVVTCSRDSVGAVGDELVSNSHVKAVSFTGSTAVGRQIGTRAGSLFKKVCLELGGKNPLIILADADIERAINAACFGVFMHQGQICMTVGKIIVDQSVADEFTERFVAHVKTLKAGNPREPSNVIGPIINQRQLEKIHDHVTDAVKKGARLLTGGQYEGLFYQPTVLSGVRADMKVYAEETFGPVASIIRVTNADEAIKVANDSEYGLSAGIITRDEERGLGMARRLETAMVHVNDGPVNYEPHVPFGGMKNSGLGRHGGKASIETFTELRWITLERGGCQYPPPFVVSS